MEAARAWAAGGLTGQSARASSAHGGGADDALADAMTLGLPADQVAALSARLARASAADVAVWPMNRKAVDAFLVVASQWRTALAIRETGLASVYVGLDYAGAEVAWGRRDIDPDAETFAGVQIMERAACDTLNGGQNA